MRRDARARPAVTASQAVAARSVVGPPRPKTTSGSTHTAPTARHRSITATPSSRRASQAPAASAAKRTGDQIDAATQLREMASPQATTTSLVTG